MASEREYQSPKHRLVRLFREGREAWKNKYMEAKATLKKHKDNLRAARISRDKWKQKAKENARRLAAAEKELADLRRKQHSAMTTLSGASLFEGWSTADFSGDHLIHHHFGVMTVALLVTYVLSSISIRASVRILEINDRILGTTTEVPSWSSVRLWLMRLGLYKLNRKKKENKNWAWIVDHTIQIGEHKCLAIAGLPLAEFQRSPRPIVYEDLEPIALVPMTESNRTTVAKVLREAEHKTGRPLQIVADRGSDVKCGIEDYCSGTSTVYTYDIKHMTAVLLKRELNSDENWQRFCKHARQMRSEIQQTRKAPLAPPKQRVKSRYMNCRELTQWASRSLAITRKRSSSFFAALGLGRDEVRTALSWVKEHRDDIRAWEDMTTVAETANSIVRHRGVFKGVSRLVSRATKGAGHPRARVFRQTVIAAIREEEMKVPKGRKLLGSSEALESSFGKLKEIEDTQASSGLTGLILSWAALLGTTSVEIIKKAMEATKARHVYDWTKSLLGPTVQGRKRAATMALPSCVEGTKN